MNAMDNRNEPSPSGSPPCATLKRCSKASGNLSGHRVRQLDLLTLLPSSAGDGACSTLSEAGALLSVAEAAAAGGEHTSGCVKGSGPNALAAPSSANLEAVAPATSTLTSTFACANGLTHVAWGAPSSFSTCTTATGSANPPFDPGNRELGQSIFKVE
eukprot:CAMPEP_0115460042 /NCGR_PEP_ID=MMETSP0271-20121206/46572_1 /TAXON_ID=71861 /ORGANISM="Scrippsiella trochoidea, Strain CCMP3099" /LENGTH=157 /DNA_ID=CAMNT_0002886721 /DNA_START=420 /DNA_END=894 /DNA_ORIENTATION=-